MEQDRYFQICAALASILNDLAASPPSPETSGKAAVERLYEEFPDLTPLELDAVSLAFLPLKRMH